jgi:hypothetical protein
MALKIDGTNPLSPDDFASAGSPIATVRPGETTLPQVAHQTETDQDSLSHTDAVPSHSTPPGPSTPLDDPMAKVMVQSQLRADAKPVGGGAVVVAKKDPKHEQKLDELARLPGEAHMAWKKLNAADRSAVLAKMEAHYGKAFKDQFLEAANKGKAQVGTLTYSNSPKSKLPMITDEQLKARGYRKAGSEHTGNAAWDTEVWVHPSGKTIRRDVSTYEFGKGDPAKQPAGTKGPAGTTGPGTIDDGGDEDDQQDRAVQLLHDAQGGMQDAQELMTHKPVPWDDVNAAMMRSWNAQTELDQLMGDDPDNPNPHPPDMSKVYPNFKQERDAAAALYHKLYEETNRLNPPEPMPEMPPLDPGSGG